MKIINLQDLLGLSLTVDSTQYTVDSTALTADMTAIPGQEISFSVIPREYVDQVNLIWYNEVREITYSEICLTRNENGKMIIPYSYKDIVEGDSFEITVNDMSGNLLIRFKAYATMQTDLQNYKLNIPNNGVIEL